MLVVMVVLLVVLLVFYGVVWATVLPPSTLLLHSFYNARLLTTSVFYTPSTLLLHLQYV